MEKDNIVHVDDAESTESSMGLPMAKIETSGGDGGRLEQIATMEVENYHGFTWKIVLVLLVNKHLNGYLEDPCSRL
jgi:hypothetical protein